MLPSSHAWSRTPVGTMARSRPPTRGRIMPRESPFTAHHPISALAEKQRLTGDQCCMLPVLVLTLPQAGRSLSALGGGPVWWLHVAEQRRVDGFYDWADRRWQRLLLVQYRPRLGRTQAWVLGNPRVTSILASKPLRLATEWKAVLPALCRSQPVPVAVDRRPTPHQPPLPPFPSPKVWCSRLLPLKTLPTPTPPFPSRCGCTRVLAAS